MQFMIFIWNSLMRILGLLGFILLEIIVFYVICESLKDSGYPVISSVLKIIFIIWIIFEIILKIIVGGSVNIFNYLIGRFL